MKISKFEKAIYSSTHPKCYFCFRTASAVVNSAMDTSRNRTCSEGNADDIDSIGLGCALEFFNEYDEVMGLINQLKEVYGDRSLSEKVTERFIYVLNQYQEQPHLLDRYLDDFLNHLLAIARDMKNDRTLHHMAFKFLYVITKVRGYKVVLRHLPHEVSDVEPVLSLLGEQDPKDAGTWETRYVLLLWMSIIVMIPFHMHRLDDLSDKRPLIDRIMDVIKLYLSVGDKARDAAAFLAAHFVSRPDVKEDHLREYLDWCMEMLMSGKEENRIGLQAGILSSLALLFKHGKRDDVEPHGAPVLRRILHCGFKDSASSIVRKMALKLIQRIGLSFLRVKVASWRYSRGKRSLADNLCMGDARPPEAEVEAASEEEDYDIPDETEDVVEQLLVGLRDKDTIIRWSAAKGVGRVTGRLPKELADDVVTSVLELFSLRESDSAWHGGCLALAELGRRGLILPQHLQKVVSVVVRALVYDEQRGNFSVGSHIRDAACYVCWSFARAYEPQVLEPYVRSIAGALLVTTVFDREITCRRAASAAFQENVGRQGTFPHGIEILTETDYYAVGSRTNSFLHLSVHIAQFSEYTRTLMDHLLEHKIKHWDPAVRELASKSLHNLTPSDAAYVTDAAVPLLLDVAVGMDLNGRHGAILSLGEVIHALALYHRGDDRTIEDILGPQVMGSIKSLVYTLEERGLFRGMGGILMRNAVCLLIEKCSLSALPFHKDQDLILKWQWMLDSCLRHMDGSVRAASVSALPPFCLQYLPPDSPRCHLLLAEYLEQLRATHMELRCGFALAVGALPEFVLRGRVEEVVRALGSCAEVTEEHPEWAEARRDAVRALARVARTVGVRGLGDPGALFESLLLATQDYTLDSRGEIGAIVREAAMLAIQDVVLLVKETAPELLAEDLVCRIFCVLVQQCTEKIDRTRAVAGGVFQVLLHSDPGIPSVPHREELLEIFGTDTCDELNWASPADTFRLFVRLLDFPRYTRHLLLGLIVSVGGLTESLVKYSSAALIEYLSSRRSDEASLRRICDALLSVLEDNLQNDRIVIPFFKMMNHLLPSGAELPAPAFHERLLALAWEASRKSRDPQKIVAAVDLFCNLLPFSEACRTRSLNKLAVFLCHRFPRVRKVTAGKLYEAFLTYDLPVEDGVSEVLAETDWSGSVESLRPVRDRLCAALGLQPPVLRNK